MSLSAQQREQYSRHLSLPQIGEAGQEKLFAARVVLIGAGGLGSPAAFYLAAAGVGTLGIVDHDLVELSNLQRQILHTAADLGRNKTASAADRLRAINTDLKVETYAVRLTPGNAAGLLASVGFRH